MSAIKRFITQQKKPGIQYNGFKYRRDGRRSDGRVVWRCLKSSCSAFIRTDSDEAKVLTVVGYHNHSSVSGPSPSKSSSSLDSSPPSNKTPLKTPDNAEHVSELVDEDVTPNKSTLSSLSTQAATMSIDISRSIQNTPTASKIETKNASVNTPSHPNILSNSGDSLLKEIELLQQRDDLISHLMNLQAELDSTRNNSESQINQLQLRVHELENEMSNKIKLEQDNRALSSNISELKITIEVLESDNGMLRSKCKALELEVGDLRNFYSPGDTETHIPVNIDTFERKNSFDILTEIPKDYDSNTIEYDSVVNNNSNGSTFKKSRRKSKKRRVLVLSASHGRNIGWDLNNEVADRGFEVTVFSKPGASFNTVTHDIEDFTRDFDKNDRLDLVREQCLIKFDDNTESWSKLKHVTKLATGDGYDDVAPMCVVCKQSQPNADNDIVVCNRCARGYHQLCHQPMISQDSMGKGGGGSCWQCRRCQVPLIEELRAYRKKASKSPGKKKAAALLLRSSTTDDVCVPPPANARLQLPYDVDSEPGISGSAFKISVSDSRRSWPQGTSHRDGPP
ncbi:hypothetical protein LSTR_LSTR005004 [Laodelphax striatellus]|uniref:PHD-type domain-containing protein n=1 Tax=Laodelphax striatellus TaxID=195883 RepID=A0A482XJR9_LAOST|nr:hypothetical protein LSTR_LSTR005004 [Laodelphax striatellus]